LLRGGRTTHEAHGQDRKRYEQKREEFSRAVH